MKKLVLIISYILMGLGGLIVCSTLNKEYLTTVDREVGWISFYILLVGVLLFSIHKFFLTKKNRNEEE
jgi:SNF family Na+-dependent transporter